MVFFGQSEVQGDDFLWFMLGVTVICLLTSRMLTHSRIGTVLKSVRDNDLRAEFLGYNVANYRIFVFCVSAFMSAAAGAMYAAWVGLISFLDTGPVYSIEGVIWTAVGGRGTLIGPVIGAFLVRGAEFFLSGVLADYWQLVMGGLFVFVVLVMRDGIVGTIAKFIRRWRGTRVEDVIAESDREAADLQRDWTPAGTGRSTEEI